MPSKKIALFGLSANPPGLHHVQIIERLKNLQMFDRIIVVPCGPRPDKDTTNNIEPVHRAHMLDLALKGVKGIEIDRSDLEKEEFTRTMDLERRYRDQGEIWHVVGFDLVVGGAEGRAEIQTVWQDGIRLWQESLFVVMEREGVRLADKDMPAHSLRVRPSFSGTSTEIRNRVFNRQPITGYVSPEVAAYIERYGLYQGLPGRSQSLWRLEEWKPLVFYNEHNQAARKLAASLRSHSARRANLVLALGGDGTALDAVRKHWLKRLPVLAVNLGNRGFLANSLEGFRAMELPVKLNLFHMPLLYAEARLTNGRTVSRLAFNEAGVRNRTDYRHRRMQSANLAIKVKGPLEMEVPYTSGDGAIVATPQGSTAYAMAMGISPLRLDDRSLVLAGNNIHYPEWQGGPIHGNSRIEIVNLNPGKRPLNAFVDNELMGQVKSLSIRKSRVAAAELLFLPGHDILEKNIEAGFPGFTIKGGTHDQ